MMSTLPSSRQSSVHDPVARLPQEVARDGTLRLLEVPLAWRGHPFVVTLWTI